MTPKIVKQKKVYLNQGGNEQPSFSRLEATASAEIPIIVSAFTLSMQTAELTYYLTYFQNELEDWDENNQQAGWDEINDQNTKQLIRETRKEIRASKHKSHSSIRQDKWNKHD